MAITSLTRCATDAAASLPSSVTVRGALVLIMVDSACSYARKSPQVWSPRGLRQINALSACDRDCLSPRRCGCLLRLPPGGAQDGQQVAVEADVAGVFPGQDQQHTQDGQHRVGAGGAGQHERQVHQQATGGSQADEGAQDQAQTDRQLTKHDDVAEPAGAVGVDQELQEVAVPVEG